MGSSLEFIGYIIRIPIDFILRNIFFDSKTRISFFLIVLNKDIFFFKFLPAWKNCYTAPEILNFK